MIKTFRGILTDDTQNRIRLSTKKGKIGYRIVHFMIMPATPMAGVDQQAVVKIYKVTQLTNTDAVDFSDGNLLAAATQRDNTHQIYEQTVMFEREIFNQDIYITYVDNAGSDGVINYYLELETESLTDNAAAVSTLRDIRLNPQVGA